MSLNAGLTTIHEDDIARHQAAAQSLVSKLVILESDDGKSGAALAGTGRRFVSTVSTAGSRVRVGVEPTNEEWVAALQARSAIMPA